MCTRSLSFRNNTVAHSYCYRKFVCSHKEYTPHTSQLMSTRGSNFPDCGKHGPFGVNLHPRDKNVHSSLFLWTACTYDLGFIKNVTFFFFFSGQWPKQKLRVTIYKNQFICTHKHIYTNKISCTEIHFLTMHTVFLSKKRCSKKCG